MTSDPAIRPDCPRARLRQGRALGGLFIVSGSSLVAEACSALNPDFLVFDLEASPIDRRELTHMLQAIGRSTALGLARLACRDTHLIEAALDAGADGIIVPKVSTADEAKAVVAAAKYPPAGARGLNPIRCSRYFTALPEYLARANDELIVAVQIETRAGLENVRAIAAVPGIDMLFVGCGDLAAALGHMGDVEHPDMEQAIRSVHEACIAADVVPGIFAYSRQLARHYRALGFGFIALGNDVKILVEGVGETLRDFGAAPGPGRS